MSVNVSDRAVAPPSPVLNAVQTLRDRWWMAIIAMVAGAAISFGVAATSTKQYTGESSLLIRSSNLQTLVDPTAAQNSEDPARVAATNLLLVNSSAVAERVRVALGTKESASDLIAQIAASANPDADIINISAKDPNPTRAAVLANTFAEQFVEFERSQSQQQAAAGASRLESQLASLPASSAAQRAQLLQALHNVLALQAVTTGNATVVDRATRPSSPSSPNLKRALILGLIAGLAVGLAAIFLSDLFDRRIKTIDEFESAYELRAIGSLPRTARHQTATSPESVEYFRILRSALSYVAAPSELRTVLVTSAVSGEGKTTVAAGLAHAAALAGQQVVLIEADLRRPSFQKHFDLGGDGRGLTTALVGGHGVEELLQVPLDNVPTLRVLQSGPFSPHPTDLLASPGMTVVLADLARDADLVVLDSPPLLPVADAQILLEQPMIDATLIACRTYMTTRDQARQCRAVLERQRVKNAALVVVGGHEQADYTYGLAVNGRGRRPAAPDDRAIEEPRSRPR